MYDQQLADVWYYKSINVSGYRAGGETCCLKGKDRKKAKPKITQGNKKITFTCLKDQIMCL